MAPHRPTAQPPFATVRDNDWRSIPLPSPREYAPATPVTIVMPYFEAPDALGRALAALEAQTYPRDLLEVVVVDDGSRSPPELPDPPGLNVRVVRQPHSGFGVARARNTGARAAAHDILVFLDCDMIAECGLVAAHARWHETVADAVTLGRRARAAAVDHLDADAVRTRAGRFQSIFGPPCGDPRDRSDLVALSAGLTRGDDLYRALTGCHFGIRKRFYAEVGGCDASFTRYGVEDIEFGYRAFTRGALLVPLDDALGWHQEASARDRAGKRRAIVAQRPKRRNLIAHPRDRARSPGRQYAVPAFVVTVRAGNACATSIAATVAAVLADPETDLAVRVDIDRQRVGDIARLREDYAADARVHVAPFAAALDQFPVSPFHICLPAVPTPPRRIVSRLRRKLGTAAVAHGALRCGTASIARARALHRARRAGGRPGDYGRLRRVVVERRWHRAWRSPASRPGRFPRIRRLCREAKRVDDAATARAFLHWTLQQLVRIVLRRRAPPDGPRPDSPSRRPPANPTDCAVSSGR